MPPSGLRSVVNCCPGEAGSRRPALYSRTFAALLAQTLVFVSLHPAAVLMLAPVKRLAGNGAFECKEAL